MAPIIGAEFRAHGFRSAAALEALTKARKEKIPNVVLFNYPSFSGAFSAQFATLFHSRLNLSCLVLPFSFVVPLRVEDLGLERCYLLDFLGPPGFAAMFHGNQCASFNRPPRIPSAECAEKVTFHVDIEKSTVNKGGVNRLLNPEDQDRVEMVLKYIEDADLRRWSLPDIRAFNIGLNEWRSKINYKPIYAWRDKIFKVRLGSGFHGECLVITDLSFLNHVILLYLCSLWNESGSHISFSFCLRRTIVLHFFYSLSPPWGNLAYSFLLV
ncbi:uncharacterized protein LOC131172823 [Hevea brasiliensis]|uniref:uncharacterized protein LOC131172823 n=1 Tax=Hevea brasiliensis TaxID=3981 RepID=UPI002600A7BA|nr:uncharacterized protein LOC131172823 [Hevea brasiliensis]